MSGGRRPYDRDMPTKTVVGGMNWDGDWLKWLPLISALISLGVLPKKWKGAVAGVALAALLYRHFGR